MPRAPLVTVTFTDGTTRSFDAGVWPSQRGDGVDTVEIRNRSGSTRFSGRSAYWLYREGDLWVAGAASFGYDPEHVPEVLFLPDGTMTTRTFDYVPDLPHRAIKLGWWR